MKLAITTNCLPYHRPLPCHLPLPRHGRCLHTADSGGVVSSLLSPPYSIKYIQGYNTSKKHTIKEKYLKLKSFKILPLGAPSHTFRRLR